MKQIILTLLVFTSSALATDEETFIKKGSAFTESFLLADSDSIWKQMTAQMQASLGNADALREFAINVTKQTGAPGPVVQEDAFEKGGYHVYRQVRRFANAERPVEFQWVFDETGAIAGFFVRPVPEPPSEEFEDYQTRTELRLPFRGEWFVFWGGRERDDNYHVDYSNQRYAYDLLILRNDTSHEGDPLINENYHCWNQPIVAPADGIALVAVDGLPDQVPGQMDSANPPGNHVIIDHGNEEYSVLAHLQYGSVAIQQGDSVSAGQQIGKCGNSGSTSEPHLHYHLQNGKQFGKGHGLPAPFIYYRRNGEMTNKGEPQRGQYIQPVEDHP